MTSSLLRVLRTANAVSPFARGGLLSVPSFFNGWLTSELPLHAAALDTIASVRAIQRGALRSWPGRAAIVFNTATAMRLVRIHRDARQAGTIFRDAFTQELGAGFEQRIEASLRTSPEPFPLARLVQPFPMSRRSLCAESDIAYGEVGKRNRLDVWKRADVSVDGRAPVLIQVHGGAWMIGNKEQQGIPLLSHLTERGWVCVSINYRLSPRATWPDHIVDVKRAIAWTKANIGRFGGDPNFIAITGGSAGGHLSSLAALSANDARFQPGFEEVDTSVQAAVPMYGVYDFTNRDGTGRPDMQRMLEEKVFKTKFDADREAWDVASTMSRIHADAPPFLVVHGANDSLVPVEQARSFVDMLRKESPQPVVYAELPGAQHAFDVFWSPRTHATVFAIEQFLNLVRTEVGQRA